jgi:hypothetical protein
LIAAHGFASFLGGSRPERVLAIHVRSAPSRHLTRPPAPTCRRRIAHGDRHHEADASSIARATSPIRPESSVSLARNSLLNGPATGPAPSKRDQLSTPPQPERQHGAPRIG